MASAEIALLFGLGGGRTVALMLGGIPMWLRSDKRPTIFLVLIYVLGADCVQELQHIKESGKRHTGRN